MKAEIALAIIPRGKKVLIIKRAVPDQSVVWAFPGGKIESGETGEEAVRREVAEEVGLDVVVQGTLGERLHPVTEKVIKYYICSVTNNPAVKLRSEEIANYKWADLNEVRMVMGSLFTPVADYIASLSKIKKAGAIITSHQNNAEILLLYRSVHKDWSFPKGHIEPGEDSRAAMIREIAEETGLSVELRSTLPAMRYTNNSGQQIAMDMYLVESNDDSKLRSEHKGDTLRFVTVSDAEDLLSYDNLKEYLHSIKQIKQTN